MVPAFFIRLRKHDQAILIGGDPFFGGAQIFFVLAELTSLNYQSRRQSVGFLYQPIVGAKISFGVGLLQTMTDIDIRMLLGSQPALNRRIF